ncbi:MAG: polyprenyl synthetase family protein [Actinomyces sp.]|uniref:polyprenyl synthetase family protein n=1 Tax=Actinomyces sp. TaxID=29317 RepID=UPI0026DB11FA|nr:polyprenyl synthetase family protein [Actinomyces sp.]MDO4242183.1 polyprenyl synthetase family protein [Actinomyces sp.]
MIGSLPLHAPELEGRIVPALEAVETRLLDVVSNADETINPPTSHLAEAGGKRLRPVLTLLTAQLGDPDLAVGEAVRDAGVAVELTHIATLYHDDVMDDAPLRRGAPSAQTVWGNSAAILTGDVLVARASQLVAGLGPEAVLAHAKTFERLCMGQLHETLPRPAGTDPVAHYIQVLADKTGSLIAVSARYGAMLSGAGAATERIVETFGEKIGVAYQLADDCLDVTSDARTSGKTPGTDLREGVDTMPVLLLRQALAAGELDAAGQSILSALSTADLADDAVLAEVVARLRAHPVLARTRQMAVRWAEEAVEALGGLEEAVLEGTRARLEAAGLDAAARQAELSVARERVRLVRAGLEQLARLLVDRAA